MSETVVCVGAVVLDEGSILFVCQSKGHDLEGQWTIPWGRVQSGESPSSAAIRETREEAGIDIDVAGLLGVQELPEPWSGWIGIIYLCRAIGGTLQPQDRETDAAQFYSLAELNELAEPKEPLSEWLARRIFAGDFVVIGTDQSNPLQYVGTFL